ncbi:prephenate dehydrogenase [Peribacillus alkalitolerans]|uniref:prephenate dehydrogenase n=1 Tax=Peribacillus alkalitolerans TaxID=1550385 RepID=UPI0013D234AF|nr:prephenate dehydrogenase [Peribacillus alkalitolerans]
MRGNIFVIGIGLIAGSVALSIKQAHSSAVVIGYDINEQNIQLSKALGIIDKACNSFEEGAKEADLIIIGTPVKQTEEILEQLTKIDLKPQVIVTDVGSTKKRITEKAQPLIDQGYTFIGGHPMAGSHKSGPAAAKAHLFENAFYLLTPSNHVEDRKLAELKAWLSGTKARFLVVDPDKHDELTGVVSHFPHLIAASLVNQARTRNLEDDLVMRLAAGGFRDITRIASSSPEMWRDIFIHNKDVLISLLDKWVDEMDDLKTQLLTENEIGLFRYFQQAKDFRDGLPVQEKGALPSFYDLFIDVPDYPGVISEITGLLAKESISITNIRILETREEIYGVLVISFQTEEDRISAEKCIQSNTTYETYLS